MKVQLNHHSVVLMVGPTGCGKRTFIEDVTAKLNAEGIDSMTLSSDFIRRSLLQSNSVHKHDPRMLEVSEQAFKQLFSGLESLISFPVNCPFVFIDTRGFDPVFRKQISDIAKRNGYNIVCCSFEFKNAKDYSNGLPEAEAKITDLDVSKFRRKVLPELKSRDFNQMIKVKAKLPADQIEVEVLDDDLDLRCNIFNEAGLPIAVIGDVHECIDQFQELFGKIEETIPGDKLVVQLGDYLDKGGNTESTLKLMSDFSAAGGYIVRGNHEAYVYRRLKGEIQPAAKEIEETYFTALPTLLENEELRKLFFKLYESSLPFIKIVTPGQRTLYVTHAPCENKWLGKYSFDAQKNQRNLYVKDRERDIREEMRFIYDQAVNNHPLHVFGHVCHNSPSLVFKNKVFLDTGAVHGGKLTAMILKGNYYDFVSVEGPKIEGQIKDLPTNLTKLETAVKKFNIHDYDLTSQDIRFLNGAMRNGIKYISGTMAPAPSWDGALEPLEGAFEFFRKRGIEQVVLEPKYMGSRCQFYLYRDDLEKCFAASRNGYRIKHVEGLDVELKRWHDKVYDWYDGAWTEIILDGELLPWTALGKGLVDHQFRSYEALVGKELALLNEDGVFGSLDIAEHYDLAGRIKDVEVFSSTLDLYGNDAPLEYRSFNILGCDGRVVGGTPEIMFGTCGDDPFLVVNLSTEDDLTKASEFFTGLTVGRGMEGVVVKPMIDQWQDLPSGVPEYMKVRNENYLTLVYGYDYKRRYHKLVSQKNISGKVAVSIRESKLARAMLTADEDTRRELIVKMIAELKKEHTLDPRL